jgi:hypothetical protein
MSGAGRSALDSTADDEGFDFGALEDAQSPQGSLAMLYPQALADVPLVSPPARVVLSAIPPVVAQGGTTTKLGSPGTCESQSFGYGLGSTVASLNTSAQPIRDVALQSNEVSRAWLYAKQIHQRKVPCKGTLAFWYLNELILNGAASEAQVPYENTCQYLTQIGTSTEPPNAAHFKIAGFSSRKISFADMQEVLPIMKAVLASGFPIAFSGLVPDDYGHLTLQNGVYYPQNFVANSGHGQFIVGYDDNMGAPGKSKGAFLVQNSFGTLWPFIDSNPAGGGRIWYSYEGFFLGQSMVATAYPLSSNASATAGSLLHANKAGAPRVTVTRSYQWTPDGRQVYFIVQLAFSEPMRLSQISITENPPTSVTASGGYGSLNGNFLSQNYAFFQRSDGKAFLTGRYTLQLQTAKAAQQDDTGTLYTYSGQIAIGPPRHANLSRASMQGAVILDSILAPAILS